MKRIISASGKLKCGIRACAILVLCAATAVALPAQTFTTLQSFDGTRGAQPVAPLLQATDGKLYGTTIWGGSTGANIGTVFNSNQGGALTTLYSFCAQVDCPDGSQPSSALVQVSDGDFYGTTVSGGVKGQGTVFKITADGRLTTLYNFCSHGGHACSDGTGPSGLTQADSGDFYGTTAAGGAHGV